MGNCLEKLLKRKPKRGESTPNVQEVFQNPEPFINEEHIYVGGQIVSCDEEGDFASKDCSKDALFEDLEKHVKIEDIKVSIDGNMNKNAIRRKSKRQHTVKHPKRNESMMHNIEMENSSERSNRPKRVFKTLNKRKNSGQIKIADNYYTKDQEVLYALKKKLDTTPKVDKPQITEWKIMKQIGQGSFGKVYYVFDS
ncbi:unnamed protein product [Moneuplotes crassus]|uniref:Uncharacterized protein n=1 Tax=Euplotes crassus TaxID=5936 RepID=A0AAD2D6M3_EUPCR|nr:unnamed protein product [Moneuplotes crassus]